MIKHLIILVFSSFLFISGLNAQHKVSNIYNDSFSEENKSVYIFETYQDFQNKKGKYVGEYVSTIWQSSVIGSYNQLKIKDGNKTELLKTDKYWGYRVGDYIFRSNTSSPKIPLVVIGIKEKVFYMEGYLTLSYLLDGYSYSHRSPDKSVFYSDDLEGKIFYITDILKKEKNNSTLANLNACIKPYAKGYAPQSRFDAFTKCIKNFISDGENE